MDVLKYVSIIIIGYFVFLIIIIAAPDNKHELLKICIKQQTMTEACKELINGNTKR